MRPPRWHPFPLRVRPGTSKPKPGGALTVDSRDIGFSEKVGDKASQLLLLREKKRKYSHPIIQFNSTKLFSPHSDWAWGPQGQILETSHNLSSQPQTGPDPA